MRPRDSLCRWLDVAIFGLWLVASAAWADGMLIRPHEDRWLPSRERSQDVLILYRGGIQRMLLAIEVENPDSAKLVWIVPIPAVPGQVAVDIMTGFPRIHGTEVFGGAEDRLGTMGTVAAGMQVWPVAGLFVFYMVDSLFTRQDYGPRGKAPPTAKAEAKKAAEPPLTVHQHVEKAGMVSEVITAKEGGALYHYLERKGLKIKPGALPVLDYYVGKDYTFIASWLDPEQPDKSGSDGARSSTRGIEVRFPSREIFFPLRPTSIYGQETVPASIRVAGYVTPRPYADISAYTTAAYYSADYVRPDASEFRRAFDERGNGRYTKVDIKAPSTRFTDDLWIAPVPPATVGLPVATFIVRHPVVTFFLFYAFWSALIGVMVGWLLYKDSRTRGGALRLAAVGLANCLTFIGLIVAGYRVLPKGRGRFAVYLACFSVLFIVAAFMTTFGASGLLNSLRP